jgi:hypothetical protein
VSATWAWYRRQLALPPDVRCSRSHRPIARRRRRNPLGPASSGWEAQRSRNAVSRYGATRPRWLDDRLPDFQRWTRVSDAVVETSTIRIRISGWRLPPLGGIGRPARAILEQLTPCGKRGGF